MISAHSRPNGKLPLAFVVLSLSAIFYLPYFVPQAPSASDSYLFGYNNRIGIILVLLLSAAWAIWARGLNIKFSSAGASPRIPLRFLGLLLVIESATCFGMYRLVGHYGGFGEATHNIHQIWLVSGGKLPFVDSEWINGCSLIYVPYAFSRMFRLTIPNGYYLFWWLATLSGVTLLYFVINLVDYPSKHKTAIFLIVASSSLLSVLSMGVNYSLVRYTCPLLFILLIHRTYQRSPPPKAQLRAGILAVVFSALLFVISPEVAFAHIAASGCLTFPYRSLPNRKASNWLYFGTLIGLGALVGLAYKTRILDSMLLAAGGDYSFPIFLSLHILFFFSAVFICFCYLVRRFFNKELTDNTLALTAFSVPMTAAALGRCDIGHVSLNGLGFFLAAFFYCSGSPRAWRLYSTVYVLCFFVIGGLLSVWTTASHGFTAPEPAAPKSIDFPKLYPELNDMTSGAMLEAPLGYSPNLHSLYESPQIDYGHYEGIFDVVTPRDVQMKIGELSRAPRRYLLLRKNFESACKIDARQERFYLSILFASPYFGKAVHTQSIYKPLCDYILANYKLADPPSQRNFEYGLWKPKGAKGVSAQSELRSQSSFDGAQPAGRIP